MVAVEHVLDLEKQYRLQLRPPHFRLGSILQLLGGPKCKIRPWVESSGFEGGRKSSEIAFRMAIEMKTCLAMVISHVINGLFALTLPKVPDREIEHRSLSHPCRKAVRQQRLTATSKSSQTVKLAKAD